MGLFWDYFRDTLRFPPILKSGPLALLAEGGASTLDTARAAVLQLRDQFFPTRCEDAILDRFAASRGIIRAPLEPLDHWHGRVRFAYLWWASGGRESAVIEALKFGFGFTGGKIVNLRAEDPERWASFRLVLDGAEGDILTRIDQITWAVNEVKRASSKMEAMRLYAVPKHSARRHGIGTVGGQAAVIYPYTAPEIAVTLGPYRVAACQLGIVTTIYPES